MFGHVIRFALSFKEDTTGGRGCVMRYFNQVGRSSMSAKTHNCMLNLVVGAKSQSKQLFYEQGLYYTFDVTSPSNGTSPGGIIMQPCRAELAKGDGCRSKSLYVCLI